MYGLDINFIKERPDYKQDTGSRISRPQLPTGDLTTLYLGLGTLVIPALVLVGWLVVQSQNARMEGEIGKLDQELSTLSIQEQEITKIQENTAKVRAETQALATVFNQIRPWSAMLQDLRDRIPQSVQIETIKQTATAAAQPTATATPQPTATAAPQPNQNAPNPTADIEITGIARSFSDVNDFLLTLQRSPFFKSTDTKIVTAELVNISQGEPGAGSSAATSVQLPQAVQYTIQSNLSNAPASDLLRELERKGTLGLVTRIRTLQQKGVIQQ